MIRVMIADDQHLIRQSLRIVLEKESDQIRVCGVAGNGREVIETLDQTKPDVILMDIRMPVLDGVQCTKKVKETHPEIRIIILTTFDDDEYVMDALRYGASGYLLKGISTDELISAIVTVDQGQAMLNPDIEMKLLRLFSQVTRDVHEPEIEVNERYVSELTDNEWKIITEVAKGHSNKEIAANLSFSQGTVRNYLSQILDKLGLRDRTQLAIWAVERRYERRQE